MGEEVKIVLYLVLLLFWLGEVRCPFSVFNFNPVTVHICYTKF